MEKKINSEKTFYMSSEKKKLLSNSIRKNNFKNLDPNTKSFYINELPSGIKIKEIYLIFSKISKVESIKIFPKFSGNQSSRYCHLRFKNFDHARRAFEIMNFYSDAKNFPTPIKILWNIQNNTIKRSMGGNLFVKNLPKNFGNEELFDLFSSFGKIFSCKIASDEEGEYLGYGFVHFEDPSHKKEAISTLNGSIVEKKKIFVGPFISKEERGPVIKPKFTNVYIKNLEIDKCNKENIMDIFGVFGRITSIFIPKNNGKPLGFVFVNFFSPEDAEEAIFSMNNKKIGKSLLYVGKAETKLERKRNLRKNFPKKILPVKKNLKPRYLIAHLPTQTMKKDLFNLVSELGLVSQMKLIKKSEENLDKMVFLSFKKTKEEDSDLIKKTLKTKHGKILLEPLKENILKLKKNKKIFIKKNVIKILNSNISEECSDHLEKKKKVRINNRKKIFLSIVKIFLTQQKKKVLDLLFFLCIKKKKGLESPTKFQSHQSIKIKNYIHLFFCWNNLKKQKFDSR